MPTTTEWIQLQDDVRPHLPLLAQAADTVVEQEVSNYPVFLAYFAEDQDMELGLAVTQIPSSRGRVWAVRITTLEELVARQVVLRDKVDNFRQVYRNTPDSICFLIWTDGEARFGFVHRSGNGMPDNADEL
ncbi:MAG: hypothetical protein AAFY36_09035 [Bacteroidota bacterium]